MRKDIEDARDGITKGCVFYDRTQSLSDAEKSLARASIGALTTDLQGFLRYDVDQLRLISDEQAAMVRKALRIPGELVTRVYHVKQIVVDRHDHYTFVRKNVRHQHNSVQQQTNWLLSRRVGI
jgi:hypothetical protein